MGLCSSDAPDYSPVANASAESARIMGELGNKQLDFAERQYAEASPILKAIANAQLDTMRQTQEQGAEYYDYLKDTTRPVEESLVEDVTKYNTEAERERMATQAATDVEQQATREREANERNMRSMGVNPNSGKFQSLIKTQGLRKAIAKAGAMNRTRHQAENLGYAKKLDVAGLGRNLPGASTAAYGVSTGAGNSAGANTMAPGSQYMAGVNSAAGTVGQGLNMQLRGLNSVLNAQSRNNDDSGLWSGISGIAQGIGYAWPSSKKLKNKTGDIDAEKISKEVEEIPVDEWEYKDGVGDEGKHVGPYAEDMAKMGAGDGKTIDIISALGVNTAAIKGVGKRLTKLEKKVAA